jgi:ParB family chromosome partitioning protein
MSRKDRKSMLEGLMAPPPPQSPPQSQPAPETSPDPAAGEKLTAVNSAAPGRPPRPRSGAVGAISSAVSALRAGGVMELDPHTIHAGGLEDRLEDLPADDAALRRSIAAHGQQVPVLVRPHPAIEGEWQIVYGRRRVLATRDLGIRVKALARDLDDDALVMAQGQENSARRDLSFIEKVSFADRMREAGYERAAICEALSIDKTVASRMLSLADRLPRALIGAIGSAHGVGRPRWLTFAELFEAAETAGVSGVEDLAETIPVVVERGPEAPPDARFEAGLALLRQALRRGRSPAPRPAPREIRARDGRRLALARRGARGTTLTLPSPDGFEDWLLARLPDLHAAWREERGAAREEAPDGQADQDAPSES